MRECISDSSVFSPSKKICIAAGLVDRMLIGSQLPVLGSKDQFILRSYTDAIGFQSCATVVA
jgi:hypothetical protein